MDDCGIVIFIKNPELGQVKTRLAASIGNEQALDIYKQLLNHTRNVIEATKFNRYLFYSQDILHEDNWSNALFKKRLQSSGDLGQRMATALNQTLEVHQKAMIIGSDCPGITTELMKEAYEELERFDVVIGPTLDGGFYLLGVKENMPNLYRGVPWSSGREYEVIVQRLLARGKTIAVLQSLSDIDYWEDWVRYGLDLSLRLNNNKNEVYP